MIKVFPSRLEGEPMAKYEIRGKMLLIDAIRQHAPDCTEETYHRVEIDIDGVRIGWEEAQSLEISRDTDICVYPAPMAVIGGVAIATWVYYAVAVVAIASLAYALTLKTPKLPTQGKDLNLDSIKGNKPKPNDTIREVLGRRKVFPDYLMPPISRFASKRVVETSAFLSIGVGEHDIPSSTVRIGETPASAFGGDVSYTIYAPGADISSDARSKIWVPAPEVGATNGGTAGLDLASASSSISIAAADAILVNAFTATLIGDGAEFPDFWDDGTIVQLETPDNYIVSEASGYNRITGEMADLEPFVGMNISLSAPDDDYELVVSSYSPYVPGVPGVGGSPSSVEASAAPTTYDFSVTTETWDITFDGVTTTITLDADYLSLPGLLSELNTQLFGTGLEAQDSGGKVLVIEPTSPYIGGPITQLSPPVSVWGASPVYTDGTASSGGSQEQLAYIELEYDDATPFIGLPLGNQRMAIGFRGFQYRITDITGLTATLERLKDDGTTDSGWSGFLERTGTDFSMASEDAGANWIGPFNACQEQDETSKIEYDIYFPAGLIEYKKESGKSKRLARNVIVEWRDASIGGAWTSINHRFEDSDPNAHGHTFEINLPYPMLPQIRMRRVQGLGNTRMKDVIHWLGLRSLMTSPASYAHITTMGIKVRTGDRLSAQSERLINCVPTRKLGGVATRSIKAAVLHIVQSLGIPLSAVDTDELDDLDSTYWTPRGEFYDMVHESQNNAKEVLTQVFNAGFCSLSMDGGLLSARREGVQNRRGIITNHEMRSPLESSFKAYKPGEDFDGVDVEYVDGNSWAVETVECRLPGSAGLRVEKIQIDGVTSRTMAWRIGMRQIRKHRLQRWNYSAQTEMDALCYQYMDRVDFADDIPGTTHSALIIGAVGDGPNVILALSEPMDWSVASPMAIIRRHDGTAVDAFVPVEIDDYTVSVPSSVIDFDLVTDLSIEPARFLFGPSTKIGYPALITEINPDSDGTCTITAVEYNPDIYADDDGSPS